MISAQTFMLANLVVWVGLLFGLAVVERRQRNLFRSRTGTRYRRLTTASVLTRIEKASSTGSDEPPTSLCGVGAYRFGDEVGRRLDKL